jgi:hypothetical protein
MELKLGAIVSMRHYSRLELYKGVIIDSNYEFITVKLYEAAALETFHQGDPIAIGYEEDNLVYISSSTLLNSQVDNLELFLKVDTFEILSNKRLFERFPVSFDASLRIGSSKTDYQVLVKNISFNGMLACSKLDFPLYQEIKLDFFVGANVSLKAVIIRKTKEDHHFEYGLKLIYTDPSAPPVIKKFLNQLKKEQETYISAQTESKEPAHS